MNQSNRSLGSGIKTLKDAIKRGGAAIGVDAKTLQLVDQLPARPLFFLARYHKLHTLKSPKHRIRQAYGLGTFLILVDWWIKPNRTVVDDLIKYDHELFGIDVRKAKGTFRTLDPETGICGGDINRDDLYVISVKNHRAGRANHLG